MKAPDIKDFKGYPVIVIYTGKEYKGEEETVTLGVRKAKAVLDNVDYIRQFVDANETGGMHGRSGGFQK